jgi:hypothetical protein
MRSQPLAILLASLALGVVGGCGGTSPLVTTDAAGVGGGYATAGATAGAAGSDPAAGGSSGGAGTGVAGASGQPSDASGAGGDAGGAGEAGAAGSGGAGGADACSCILLLSPVCGVDGKTYDNTCEASCAGVAVAHQGGCDDGGVRPLWNETIFPPAKRRMLLRDEGDPHVHLVDLGNPANNWSHPSGGPWSHGLQLIGNNQVLGGRIEGYEVFDLTDGHTIKVVSTFPNSMSAYRMANGETMLTRSGTVLTFLGKDDQPTHQIAYPGFGFVRMARPTRNGTFLVPSNTTLFEGDATGKVLWKTQVNGWSQIFEPLLMADGNVLVSTGFGASCDVVDKTTHMVTKRFGTKTMPDAATFHDNFFGEFEILPNGNIITANWQGHGPDLGSTGIQVIEFSPTGEVVWFYKQDPNLFSSIEGVMVLDGKDPRLLYVQDTSSDSTWQPVMPTP